MDYYYPYQDYESEGSSCCSAEIEGGVAAVDPRKSDGASPDDDQPRPKEEAANGSHAEGGRGGAGGPSHEQERAAACNTADSSLGDGRHSSGRNPDASFPRDDALHPKEQTDVARATLIQQERQRRLGDRGGAAARPDARRAPAPSRARGAATAPAPPAAGVRGWTAGWFGRGGGSEAHAPSPHRTSSALDSGPPRRSSADDPAGKRPSPTLHHAASLPAATREGERLPAEAPSEHRAASRDADGDDGASSSDGSFSSEDSDSASEFSGASSTQPPGGEADLGPQERARIRALRYLSNSCVDARRRAKTASYVRGLERLDLKRKEDRCAKELEVVEAEMNKDRGLTTTGGDEEGDAVSKLAADLARELPRVQGADAGAGGGRGSQTLLPGESFTTYDEYVAARDHIPREDARRGPPALWENGEAVEVYVSSLQSRLKEALEQTRLLQKRLAVLERTGDDIVV